jgi:transcription initiation factor IIE alpha subunit
MTSQAFLERPAGAVAQELRKTLSDIFAAQGIVIPVCKGDESRFTIIFEEISEEKNRDQIAREIKEEVQKLYPRAALDILEYKESSAPKNVFVLKI